MPQPDVNCFIDYLLSLLARGRSLHAANSAPAGAHDHPGPVIPRHPNHALRFFLAIGRIARNWGPLGCWTALSYFIIKTGHGANMFRSLSNRLAESSFFVRLLSYLFKWFGCETGLIDRVADTTEHVATFFRHAAAAFKSAKDVVTKISNSSTAVSDENNTRSNNGDSDGSTTDVATEVAPSSFSSDHQVTHSARADVELRIISSMEEAQEIVAHWKEGNGGFILDVPLDMRPQIARDLMTYFKRVGAACILEGPNLKTILEKELASAESDLEVATKSLADLRSLMRPPSLADRKTDS